MNNSKFVSLLSTGLDSPIATYLIMKKGFDCVSLSFLHNYPNSNLNELKITKIGELLKRLTKQMINHYLVNYDTILRILMKQCDDKSRCILCKRTMLDIAQIIANKEKARFIVTGEILGEQASQTINNLFVTDKMVKDFPIIRPLIGFNKLDIIKLSQDLGFYEISLLKENPCSFNPKYPETRADINKILKEEEKINRGEIREIIIKNIKKI